MLARWLLVCLALALGSTAFARGGHAGGGGGSHYVAPHVTKNGTYVQGHYQSNPNGTASDNWSTKGNVNPYTGEAGNANPSGSGLKPSVPSYSTPAPAYSAPSPSYSAPPATSYPSHAAKPSYLSSHSTHSKASSRIGERERSSAARAAFQRRHPCPSTGRTTGACPGYVVDHVTALKRGGADAPSNMQWQTIDAAKAKDRVE